MNEDGSHQSNGNDMSPVVEHSRPLDSETANEIPGTFIKNLSNAAASELIHSKSSRMQSKLSEMHNDLAQHSSYGLWMSPEGSVMGNGEWRNQGPSHESLVHWSALLPVTTVAGVAHTEKNTSVESSQKIPNCSLDASTMNCNSSSERIANSESGLVMKWKDTVDFVPGREREQFNLWKIASLIRGISPSDKGKRKDSDVRDESSRHGSLMDDTKTAERLWTFGQNDRHMKMKKSSALSYPVFGSETVNSDLDLSSKTQLFGQNPTESQFIDNSVVARNQREQSADSRPAVVPSLKAVERLARKKSNDVLSRMKLIHTQSPESEYEANGQDIRKREMSLDHSDAVTGTVSLVDTGRAANNAGVKQPSVGSSRSALHDVASHCVEASKLATLPAESASSRLTGHDKSPAPSLSVSESPNNGISLYRRRVKSLLLKQGNCEIEGCQAELPRSPRIQNRFETVFEHGDSSLEVVCGNKQNCDEEHDNEMNSETLCNSVTESDRRMEHVAMAGCHAGQRLEQGAVSNSDMLSGTSCAVVNSETLGVNCHRHVSSIDCSCTAEMVKDGVRPGCVEKGLQLNVGGLCCHSAHDSVSHSVCQCCTDVSTHRLSSSCQLPIKLSPAVVCDVAAKCGMNHHVAALPTPTRACAAALCQLSCSSIPSYVGSPKGMDTFSRYQFSHPKSGSQCNTPCSQAVVKCACVKDGRLAPVHQSSCPCSVTNSSVRGCLSRIFHQEHLQQPGDTQPQYTPCMAHTPYTPREAYTPREPDTPQDSNAVCEPCTPQNLCSHHAGKYPRTPTAACYFQFPPLHASQLDWSSSGVCQSPCVSCARRLPSCHTPCMSPLNLTIGQPCVARTCTPQCCFQHQKQTSSASRHRHSCVCFFD